MKKYNMKINGQHYEARIVEFSDSAAKITVNGINFDIEFESDDKVKTPQIIQMDRSIASSPEIKKTVSAEMRASNDSDVKAPIPGIVVSILKKEGEKVSFGDVLLTLEAMKMESEILAQSNGVIEKIYVKERSTVQEGDILVKIVGG